MGDLFPWLSDHTIRVLAMIGSWVAPPVTILGTLWLARRAEKPRLHVRVKPRVPLHGFGHRDFSFSVTNVGQRLTTVEGVGFTGRMGWRRVWYRKGETLQLEAGENFERRMTWHDVTEVPDFTAWRCLRAAVYTPTARKTVRIGRELRNVLRQWRRNVEAVSAATQDKRTGING